MKLREKLSSAAGAVAAFTIAAPHAVICRIWWGALSCGRGRGATQERFTLTTAGRDNGNDFADRTACARQWLWFALTCAPALRHGCNRV